MKAPRPLVLIPALLTLGVARADNQPERSAVAAFKLYGLAFSPYVDNQNPSAGAVNLTPQQIDQRLSIVAPYTQWIRTYGCGGGLGATAAIARSKGLKLVIGADLGSENPAKRPNGFQLNRAEIDCAVSVVSSGDILAIGNETLLRGDLTSAQLISHLQYARQRVPSGVTVTTVDTYGTLIQNWEVLADVPIVLANIFPYWEGVAADQAVRFVDQAYNALRAAANGKEVIIAETGWPSGGPANGPAVPSIANASSFFLEFVSWARANNLKYFYFEAFDELWKESPAEPVGAHWGLWDRFGNIKAGMQSAFDSASPAPYTSPCETLQGVSGAPPVIAFTYVPPLGAVDEVQGRTANIVPANHRVAFYIKAFNGLWYIKPTLAQPVTPLRCDGTFSVRGIETDASEVRAFLLPESFTPPAVFGASSLPQTLFDNDVTDPASIERKSTYIKGTVRTSAGTPVPGIRIEAAAPIQIAATNAAGLFAFPSISPGATITVTPSGAGLTFTPASRTFTTANGALIADFTTDLPPCQPSLPSPADSAGNVAPGAPLTWSGCEAGTSYDIYLDTVPSPRLVASRTTPSYSPGSLIAGVKYYWKVTASNGKGTSTSPLWSFTVQQPAPASGSGLAFVPVTPCRIVDTRLGAFGGSTLAGGEIRQISLPLGPCAGLAAAEAYSLNVTVVPREPLAYLTIWPTGRPQPFVSTLNSFEGRVKANAAIVPAGTNGSVSIYVTNATDVILDINGYFAPRPATPLTFFPLAPCRLVDTRIAGGPFAGARTFALRQLCGLPANAEAYSVNATVVPAAALAFLTLWSGAAPMPTVSTLNAFNGGVIANAAVVPAAADGSITAYATDSTHLILDVNGYFARATGGLSFYPLTPCRLVDTRANSGSGGWFGPAYLAADTSRSFPVNAGSCAVPVIPEPGSITYSGNVTVVPSGGLGFLTLWPTGSLRPLVSTLNSFQGLVVSNAVLIPAGTGGEISAYVTDRTEVIFDLNGYFAP